MFLIDNVALTIAPPEESVTVPDKVPPTTWECTKPGSVRIKINMEVKIEPTSVGTEAVRVIGPFISLQCLYAVRCAHRSHYETVFTFIQMTAQHLQCRIRAKLKVIGSEARTRAFCTPMSIPM